MPGLFGIVGGRAADQVAVFERAFPVLAHGFSAEGLTSDTGEWAIGRAHLGILQPDAQLSRGRSLQVLFHGDLHNAAALARSLDMEAASPASAIVARLYDTQGTGALQQLRGAYCLALIDPARRRTLLATDQYASYPLYWTTAAGQLVFGSSLKAILLHPSAKRQLDPTATADYVAFGFPLGLKTLAADVHLVPQGSVLTFDWSSAEVSTQTLFDIQEQFTPWSGSREEYLEALCGTFQAAVKRTLDGQHRFGMSLSGGLDSRAILSAMNGQAPGVASYTLGVKGCADHVIADRLARMAGTHHTFFELDERYLREFLPNLKRMVSLTDGMYLSHGLTEMLALGFLEQADFSVLLRGHGGELAKTNLAWPLHTDDRILAMTSRDEFVPYLFDRANYISPGLEASDLFTAPWVHQIDGAARRSLNETIRDVALAPADLCSYLYLVEHHRRFTIPSLELFRHAVEIRMPFVDPDFLRVLFSGRPEWRSDTTIHRAITAAGNRALLRVRNSNTGAPGDASPRVEFALDKLNTVLKRLNVYGFRHYHNFQAWMRQQLLSSVETVLLGRESLNRGVLREEGLRRLLSETRAGQRDHSYLLQVLLILELWQQENL